jgi:hypothetical protein
VARATGAMIIAENAVSMQEADMIARANESEKAFLKISEAALVIKARIIIAE